MIVRNGKEVTAVYRGSRAIQAIYKGSRLIWQASRSCYGSGAWIDGKPWIDEESWKE